MRITPVIPVQLVALLLLSANTEAGGNSTFAGNYTAAAAFLSTLQLPKNHSQPLNNTRQPFQTYQGNKSVKAVKGGKTNNTHARVIKSKRSKANWQASDLQKNQNSRQKAKDKPTLSHEAFPVNTSNTTPRSKGAEGLQVKRQRNRRQTTNSIPLTNQNFTTIGQDCSRSYRLAEDISLTQSNNNALPLCTQFSGSFQGNGYRVKGSEKTLFKSIHNASIAISMDNNLAVNSSDEHIDASVTGAITNTATYSNNLSQTNSNIMVIEAIPNSYIRAGGGFGEAEWGSSIIQNQTGCNITVITSGIAGGGGAAAYSSEILLTQSRCNIYTTSRFQKESGGGIGLNFADNSTIIQTDSQINALSTAQDGLAGGGMAYFWRGDSTLIQTNCQINASSPRSAGGGVANLWQTDNSILIQTDSQINALATAEGGLAGGGVASLSQADNDILIQTGCDINATASSGSAGGAWGEIDYTNATLTQIGVRISASGNDRGATFGEMSSSNIKLRLFSGVGDGDLPVCGDVNDYNGAVSGIIDVAGYNVSNPSSCGEGVAKLDTTKPAEWREAHSEFCNEASHHSEQASCHYPHEELLTSVPGDNNTIFLISRQRYPFNTTSEDAGLMRISRLQFKGNSAALDSPFGINGTQLFSRSSNQGEPLPEGRPIASAAGHGWLITLYPPTDTGSVPLARFPLTGDDDGAVCECVRIQDVQGEPFSLTIDESQQAGIWTREAEDTSDVVRYYQPPGFSPDSGFVKEYNLTWTDFPGAPVIGLGSDADWLYVARRNSRDVALERIDRLTGQLNYRSTVLKDVPPGITGHSIEVSCKIHANGNRIALLPKDAVSVTDPSGLVKGLKFTLPEYGGDAEWEVVGEQNIVLSMSTALPPETQTPASPPLETETSISLAPPTQSPIFLTPEEETVTSLPLGTKAPTFPPVTDNPDIVLPVAAGGAACIVCGVVVAGSLCVCMYCKKKIKARKKRERRQNSQEMVDGGDPQLYETPVVSVGVAPQPLVYDYARHPDVSRLTRAVPSQLRGKAHEDSRTEADQNSHEYEVIREHRVSEVNPVPPLHQAYEQAVSIRGRYEMAPLGSEAEPHGAHHDQTPHIYDKVGKPKASGVNRVHRESLPQVREQEHSIRNHYEMAPLGVGAERNEPECDQAAHIYDVVQEPKTPKVNRNHRESRSQVHNQRSSIKEHYEMAPLGAETEQHGPEYDRLNMTGRQKTMDLPAGMYNTLQIQQPDR